MAFRIHRGIWQFQKPDGAYESKYKLNDSGQLVETDTEGNEVGGMTASVSWTSVSGRPTALSGFTNDLGNYGGWLSTSGKAADANLLDGIDSSRIVYGDGANGRSISRSNGSANVSDSSNASGFYFGYNVTGMPTTDWWNWLTVRGNSWSGSDGYHFQLAGSFWGDDYRIRRMQSGTNQPWVSLVHSGNIGSQSVNYANSSGNSSTTSQTSFSSLSTSGGLRDSLNRRFTIPDGGSYVTTTSVITGAIRIKLPTQGSGMMMTCTAKVYEYSLSKSFTITFGGHRDGNNWYNQFCYIDGDTNRGNLTVRFGVSDGRDCVWIGETNSSWSYPQVFITDVQIGYSAIYASWASGWSIDFVTSFDTINRTSTAYAKITNANIGSQSVNYAASAGNADTVDGWHRDDLRAWGNLTGVPSTFSPSAHTHDDRYYTESEVDTLLAGKQAAGSYAASNHNHTYNVNDDWLRENGDNANFKIYGNSRSVIYRTDGTTNEHGGGGYPHIWYYGGSADGNRVMIINTSGQLWLSNYGWLHDYFQRAGSYAASSHTHAISEVTGLQSALDGKLSTSGKAADSNLLDGLDSSAYLRDDGWNSHPGQDADTQGTMRSDFTYSNRAPWTGELVRFGASGYSIQLNGQYSGDGGGLSFRNRNGDNSTWNPWYQFIHSGNIGSQSVNYASSAGAVAWGNVSGKPSTFSPSAHTHDDRYYTESESDTRFATAAQGAKADSALQSLPAHTHDDRYYTESESLSLFARKDTNSAIGGNLVVGNGTYGNATAYGNSGARLMFSGSDSDAQGNYYIGTNHENYGGNYSKLDLRWHTGIRMGAQPGYGGIRFYNNEDFGSRIMSIGESDGNVRIDNNLWIGGAGGWITDLLAGKQAAGSYAAASHTHDYVPLAGGTMSGTLTLKDISGVSQTVPNSYGAYLHLGTWGDGRTAAGAVLVNTAYRADYADNLFDMNISRFTNNSGYITAYGAQGANGNFYIDDNYGNSVVGVYASTRYQGVYAMGDSYKLAADGTSPGTLYGIAWTHTNVGGESKSGLGHQALFMMNGRTYTAIGSGIWTDGTITTTSHGTSANWKTAYDWGNHASAGYLTSLPSHNHDGSYLPIGGKAADSNLLDGLDLHTGRNNEANKVVRTDGNGYIQAGWINTPSGATTSTLTKIYASQDDYIRYVTPAEFRRQITDGVYQAAGSYAASSHTHTPSQVGLGNVSNAAQVTTSYNSSLNSDSRNSRGVTRLYRRDSDSDYSVQTHWTGSHWFLRGYSGDNFHAEARVGYADSAGSASSASSATTATNVDNGNVYTTSNNLYIKNSGVNNYRIHHTGGIGVFDVTSQFSIREMTSIWSATRYEWGNWMSYAWFDVDPWGDNWGIGSRPTSWKTVNRGSFLTFGFEDWSDRRSKSAIIEIDNAIDKVKAIGGYTYWKIGSEVREAGVIAQDVLEVFPEAIGGTEEGYSVKPAALIGLLSKAIKEQQDLIESLTARIEALENK